MGIWRYPLHGMFHLQERSLSWNDKVNAGANAAKCMSARACISSSFYIIFVMKYQIVLAINEDNTPERKPLIKDFLFTKLILLSIFILEILLPFVATIESLISFISLHV